MKKLNLLLGVVQKNFRTDKRCTVCCNECFPWNSFSLIFKKKFYVYCGQDGNGNARVQSVLKNVNLTDRIIHENIKIDDEEVDWNTYNKWVEYERQRSLDYIVNSIR